MSDLSSSTTELGVEVLTSLRLFQGESPEALVWLLDCCELVSLQPEQVLLELNTENSKLFSILSGTVRIELEGGEPIRYLSEGESVGELSVLDEQSTTARVIADEHCQLLVLEREAVWQQINKSNVVARNLLFILSDRMRHNSDQLQESLCIQRMLKEHATVDCLTGLYNRRWLDGKHQRLLERSNDSGHAFSIILLDVDHFKKYNDSHGHPSGDQALCAVADTMQSHLRVSDCAVRYGGEEFLIILPETIPEDTLCLAERVRIAISEKQVFAPIRDQLLPSVTVSAGVAHRKPGETWKMLIERADKALYQAKCSGRNRVVTC